jgi:hypothetical protein
MLAVVLSIVTLAAMSATRAGLAAQTPAQPPGQTGQMGMAGMANMHETMMAEMKAGDARLETLVKAMNAAAGDAKTNAIAAVVNELVAQHRQMHAHMNHMHHEMIGGRAMMMKH